MGSRKNRRPSPAMVVACLALIFAIAGTAVAASGLTKKQKKQVAGIAATQVNKLAPTLSVAKAGTADSASTANSANTAGNAGQLEGSSLSQIVPGNLGFQFSCVLSTSFSTCATLELTLSRTANVLVVATTQWFSPDAVATSVDGRCNVRLGTGSTSNVPFGTTSNDTDGDQTRTLAFIGEFTDVPAGTATFELRCIADAGNISLIETRVGGFATTS
jgi:hypothetical protein